MPKKLVFPTQLATEIICVSVLGMACPLKKTKLPIILKPTIFSFL
jgi:hypothetical protein